MRCKDNFTDNFSIMDAELLEEVEPPYLVSLSDSHVSNRDVPSDCNSSDTFEVSDSSVNKAFGGSCCLDQECLSVENNPNAEYKKDLNLKSSLDFFFDSEFRVQSFIFSEWKPKCLCHGIFKDRISHSISSLNLSSPRLDCSRDVNKILFSLNGCGRNDLSNSKRSQSLPNLDFTFKHEMICIHENDLYNIPYFSTYSENSLMRIPLLSDNAHSLSDFFIKILLKKIHSMQVVIDEKDVLISELMNSYDRLIIKNAEAENKIDRMRFLKSMSEEFSSASTSGLKHNSKGVINNNSVIPQAIVNDVLDGSLDIKHDNFCSSNFILSAVKTQKEMRKLKSTKNEHDYKKKEFISEVNGLDIKTSDKEVTDCEVNNLLHSDPDFCLCELDNKLNLGKLEKDILHDEHTTLHKNDVLSDYDLLSLSEDELSLGSPRNPEIFRTENSLNSQKSLKNNFNNSYNKIITYAKAKRELASHPDFHILISERDENYSYETLPNIDDQNVEETFVKSTKEEEVSFESESKNFKADNERSLAIENIGLPEGKFDGNMMENFPEVSFHALSDHDNSCLNEDKNFPQKSSGFLNNALVQEKNLYDGENKVKTKCFYSRNPDSNYKISILDLKEMNPNGNRIQVGVRNNFGRISSIKFQMNEKQRVFAKVEETLEEESDSSASLGSLKLETCDCWNKITSNPQVIRSYEHENLSLESKNEISPLHLYLSSSDDCSSVSLRKGNQENDGILKSQHDAVIGSGKIEGMSQLQKKIKSRQVPLKDGTKKISETMQNLVSSDCSQKNISQIMNSLDKIDAAASQLKHKTEELKKYLSLQLDSIS